jgi:hypothetical protein
MITSEYKEYEEDAEFKEEFEQRILWQPGMLRLPGSLAALDTPGSGCTGTIGSARRI